MICALFDCALFPRFVHAQLAVARLFSSLSPENHAFLLASNDTDVRIASYGDMAIYSASISRSTHIPAAMCLARCVLYICLCCQLSPPCLVAIYRCRGAVLNVTAYPGRNNCYVVLVGRRGITRISSRTCCNIVVTAGYGCYTVWLGIAGALLSVLGSKPPFQRCSKFCVTPKGAFARFAE